MREVRWWRLLDENNKNIKKEFRANFQGEKGREFGERVEFIFEKRERKEKGELVRERVGEESEGSSLRGAPTKNKDREKGRSQKLWRIGLWISMNNFVILHQPSWKCSRWLRSGIRWFHQLWAFVWWYCKETRCHESHQHLIWCKEVDWI